MTTASINSVGSEPNRLINNRWFLLVCSIILMIMIAGVQYAWTMFAVPMKNQLHVTLPVVQYAFTIGQLTWGISQPTGGFFVDRFGPKFMTIICGAFVGLGWIFMGQAHSVGALYFFYGLAGIGCGVVYGIGLGMANRWFPDRRGLASGLIAGGFGIGCLPFLPVISGLLKSSGPSSAFLYTGIIQGVVIIALGFILHFPKKPGESKSKRVVVTEKDFRPSEILKTGQFWLLWITFVCINWGGMLLTANSAPMAKSFGIGAGIIVLAVSFQNVGNGVCRVFWGWVSDHFGRYRTMGFVFTLNAIIIFFVPILGKTPWLYVVMVFLAFFTWGEIYSLFPAVNADLFGSAFSTTDYGLLYTAKATASILGGGLGAALALKTSWQGVFSMAAGTALIAAIICTFIIPHLPKPKHNKSFLAETASSQSGGGAIDAK